MAVEAGFRCCFCRSENIAREYSGVVHPLKKDHGPFDFYRCRDCGSGMTIPPPSPESLAALYGSFERGLPDEMRKWRQEAPLTVWYQQCVDRVMHRGKKKTTDKFVWYDVGAGGGEFASLVSEQYPAANGIAFDLHDRPSALGGRTNVQWKRIDINNPKSFEPYANAAEVVVALGVWEHVMYPDIFVDGLMSLLKPGGVLYLTCPDYGSLAKKVLGRYWPFMIPGEHIGMPTTIGAHRALSRSMARYPSLQIASEVFAEPITMPYALRYVLHYFGMSALTRFAPTSTTVPLPAGALEAGLQPTVAKI